MIGPNKLFRSVQKCYQTLGVYPFQPENVRTCVLNRKILLAMFLYVQQCIAAVTFFLIEANSVLDYAVSFYTYISMLFCVYYFIILIRKMPQIIELIEKFQQFMEKSKCTTNK